MSELSDLAEEAAELEAELATYIQLLRESGHREGTVLAERNAAREEAAELRKDARCRSEDPATGLRCEFGLDHNSVLHSNETFAWRDEGAEEQRVHCPKGCGLMYHPSQAADHSCLDS